MITDTLPHAVQMSLHNSGSSLKWENRPLFNLSRMLLNSLMAPYCISLRRADLM